MHVAHVLQAVAGMVRNRLAQARNTALTHSSAMSNLLQLGLRDLPLDEVILIKTIFRLSSEQLSHAWELVDGDSAHAWIADSASWEADRARQARGEPISPTLYLSRLQSLDITPVLTRPIRAQALVQWLAEMAHALSGTALPVAPSVALAAAPPVGAPAAALMADEHEHEHWATTEPAGLSFIEPISVAPAPAPKVEPLVIPEALVHAAPLVKPQLMVVAESVRQSASGAASEALAAQQLDPDSRYLLRRWPPAQIMGNDPKRLRITSLLSKQALQLDELSNLSGASVEECEGWMSTLLHSELLDTRVAAMPGGGHAMAEGLAMQQSAALANNPAMASAPKRSLSLVSAIRRRLGI